MAAQCYHVVLALVLTVCLATGPINGNLDDDKTPPSPTQPEKATKPPPPASSEKATKPPPPASFEKASKPPPPASSEKASKPPPPASSEKASKPPPPDKDALEASATTTTPPPVTRSIATVNFEEASSAQPITTVDTNTTRPPPPSDDSSPAIGAAPYASFSFTASAQPATTTRWLPQAAAAPLASGNNEAMPADVAPSAIVEPAAVVAVAPSPASTALMDTAVAAAAAATALSTTTNSPMLATDEPTKKPPKPALGEKSPQPPLKEGENCSSSSQCKNGCCRRADGSLVDVFGHDEIQADDVLVPMQGACSKTLGDANEYCGSGCKCRGGFTCYKPRIGVCCQPELCYEHSFVNRQEAYLKRCQSRRGCTMPVHFDD